MFALSQANATAGAAGAAPAALFEKYCFDCHDAETRKGDIDLTASLERESFDGTLVFENLATGKMPPADKPQPSGEERRGLLQWLAERQAGRSPAGFRRISRHEFVQSLNDLLGTDLDLAGEIPDDRGTHGFDSDRRIKLGREMLASYFAVADEMLEAAFPEDGFPHEGLWRTDKIRDSHETYRIYHRPYREGTLFSWTRANNGNSYSFFYDGFEPPVAGYYELTFEAAKVADFEEDMSLQVYAGKYYYADDRPQPQRLVGVISLGNRDLESHTVRAFLRPGENVSVHCFSRHNFRQKDPSVGIYIKGLTARGPLLDGWPPSSYGKVFGDLPLRAGARETREAGGFQTELERIGGSIAVSSFQEGMGKEKMQDGSNLTFWHSRFTPTVAEPPHYVVIGNPEGAAIGGLSFATWTGGNGNGLVKAYEIHFSDDGESWGDRVMAGGLDTRLANEQPIVFPRETTSRFIRFLVTDSVQLDNKSIASVGKLDVITGTGGLPAAASVAVASDSGADLERVLRKFAERAFSSELGEDELAPYSSAGLEGLAEGGDFVRATKLGLKAILCSPRFLMAPGEHANPSYARAADLARALWLSVPDDELLALAASDRLRGEALRGQVRRMLADRRAQRMVDSFGGQWLRLRGLNKVAPSLKLYPEYDDLLNHFLPIETRAYLGHLVREDLPAGALIDSDFAFLNQRLARHYGIDGVVGQEIRKVDLAPRSPRGGLMTMASVLKVTTDGFDTSPILRGAWISKNIVGTPLSPPPESVPALEPEHGEAAATLKEQVELHKKSKTCYACHKSIDPYGFALESFDATGRWRERYKIKQPHRGTFQYRPAGYFEWGGAVDASGEIDGVAFDDVSGLKKLLLASEDKIAYHFAKKFFEYSNGRPPELGERLWLWDFIARDPQNRRLATLMTEVLAGPPDPEHR